MGEEAAEEEEEEEVDGEEGEEEDGEEVEEKDQEVTRKHTVKFILRQDSEALFACLRSFK